MKRVMTEFLVWEKSEKNETPREDLANFTDVYRIAVLYTFRQETMRTNIDIDDILLSRAMTASGLKTKRATVEEGLRLLVRVRKQVKALAQLKGLGWTGDLNEMRQGRP
jgi:Arc/MetJ family transcription regulator